MAPASFSTLHSDVPILFLVFNRPDVTRRVFEAIRKQRPSRLFIAADGPRTPEERLRCDETRTIVHEIDWPCEVKTLFREENLGLRPAVSGAISWFFQHVESGIILEDDCLPSHSFFSYCGALLEHYKDDPDVLHIAGENPLDESFGDGSYYFSSVMHCWGWATWRHAWQYFSEDYDRLEQAIGQSFKHPEVVRRWTELLNRVKSGKVSSWAYLWTLSILAQKGLCINPGKNLISNIGFDTESTHCKDKDSLFANRLAFELYELKHPSEKLIQQAAVEKILAVRFGVDPRRLNHQPVKKLSFQERLEKELLRAESKKNHILHGLAKIYRQQHQSRLARQAEQRNTSALQSQNIPRQFDEGKSLSHLCHINTVSGRGGAAKVSYEMLHLEFLQRGYHSTFFTRDVTPKANDHVISMPFEPDYQQKLALQKQTGLLDFYWENTFELKNHPEFMQADVLHLHNLHGNYFNLHALPELTAQRPTVWTLHDMQSFTGHCGFSYSCDRWLSGCGDCPSLDSYPAITTDTTAELLRQKAAIYEQSNLTIVCVSQWMKNQVENSLLKNKPVRLIYNGIDETTFKPCDSVEARKKLGLPLDRQILFFAANLAENNPQKGTEFLQQVYQHFKGRKDVLIISAGGDKNEYVDGSYFRLKYVSDDSELALMYNAANLTINPTLAEAFGLTIVESLACGTPVITFNHGPMPELIEHLSTGYLADYRDGQDFIRGIELFLADDSLQKSAGSRGRQVVEERFTRDRMVNEYEALYQELLAASPPKVVSLQGA